MLRPHHLHARRSHSRSKTFPRNILELELLHNHPNKNILYLARRFKFPWWSNSCSHNRNPLRKKTQHPDGKTSRHTCLASRFGPRFPKNFKLHQPRNRRHGHFFKIMHELQLLPRLQTSYSTLRLSRKILTFRILSLPKILKKTQTRTNLLDLHSTIRHRQICIRLHQARHSLLSTILRPMALHPSDPRRRIHLN